MLSLQEVTVCMGKEHLWKTPYRERAKGERAKMGRDDGGSGQTMERATLGTRKDEKEQEEFRKEQEKVYSMTPPLIALSSQRNRASPLEQR